MVNCSVEPRVIVPHAVSMLAAATAAMTFNI
jgi:hypothetical protein